MNKPLSDSQAETIKKSGSSFDMNQRQGLRKVLMLGVPIMVLILFACIYLLGGRYVETDNAYIKASKIALSAEVSGMAQEVFVKENQLVNSGQLLVKLDDSQYLLVLKSAQAHLAQVKSELSALKVSYAEQEAQIKLAQTRLDFAQKELKQQSELLDKQFISQFNFDQKQEATEIAKQQVLALQQGLKRIEENLGGDINLPLNQQSSYQFAQAEIEQAELNLQRTEIKAPRDGVVNNVPNIGQYIRAGSAALSLVAADNMWVEANLTEKDLSYLQAEQLVSISVDSFPGKTWTGKVQSISPATGSEFSVIPAQNATGNWVKIAQRVAVRIQIDPVADMPQLRAGLSAKVKIDSGHHRHLLGLSL